MLVAGGAAWWKLRGDGPRKAVIAAGDDPWAGTDEEATKALIARKRAARGDAPADATPASLSGRVTRKADGSGVAGAVVTISVREFGGALFATLTGGSSIVVVADGGGAWTATDVSPGRHVVTAAAAGLLPGSVDLVVAPREARRGVDLALAAGGAEVSGMVSDIGGGAIAAARVTVRPYGLSALDSSAAYVAVTGDDGRYAMTLPEGSWHAKVTQDDYTDGDRAFELRAESLTLDFSLTPGGSIRGQVVARDSGKPVAGARVTVSGGHGRDDDDLGGLGGVETDDDGNFVLRGLASGALALRATGRGYASAEPTGVDLAIGEEVTGVKVMVDRAYTISGFVVRDGTAGEGVGGVRVGVFSIAKETGMFAQHPSAADGFFEITGVRPASYMIAALGEGVMLEIGRPIAVVDRDLTDVLVTMKTGATLSGKVTPAAVAKLSLEIDPAKIGIGNMFDVAKAALVHGQSDATGAFTMHSAPPGAFKLVAQTGDGRTGSIEVTITTADQTGLVIPLEARGSISGRVVDPGGAAVAGVTVEASGSGGGLRLAMGGGASETITARDGSFRVGGLDPGTVMLSVSDEDGPLEWADAAHKDAPGVPIAHTIDGAEDVTGVTLTVEARDGVIRGIVLGTDRAPMPDVWISARSSESPWAARMRAAGAEAEPKQGAGGDSGEVTVEVRTGDDPSGGDGEPGGGDGDGWGGNRAHTALTGPDGRFTIARLRRGTYSVVAEPAKGGTRAQQRGVKTGDTVTLVLEKMGSLAGVVTQGGTPVATYDLVCRGPGGNHRRHVAAADGAYSFDRLPPGKYTCDATSGDGSTSGTVTVASAPARLDLALAGWGSVTGVIVDAQGKPLAGIKVLAGDEDDMGEAFTELMSGGGPTTDAAGRFEIGRLSGGKGQLIAFSAASGMTPLVEKEFELVAGQRLDLGTLTATAGAP